MAEILNRAFVSIKVDKEERPDLDAVYMLACQAMSGSGGWPLTALATPEGVPFYAATYLPKENLLRLLNEAERLWHDSRENLIREAEQLRNSLRRKDKSAEADIEALSKTAFEQFSGSFDERWGGFGPAPKFPSPHNLLFLLSYSQKTGKKRALYMAERTLLGMYRGGIFDHVGGGFCRYATDEKWLIPHFEKMLYDNALLLWAYAEAYAVTKNAVYRQAGEKTADFVLRELTGPDGEFFGSLDADSDGGEGAYYAMTPGEVEDLLGPKDGKRFCARFGITQTGNFEGKSIPNLIENSVPEENGMDVIIEKVRCWRDARMPLRRDDKVLTSWNALMITALARASAAFGRTDYLSSARRAADYLLKRLCDGDGRLFIRIRDGEAKYAGIADDYAFCALAFLELGRKQEAEKLMGILLRHFFDPKNGGFFLYADDAEPLFIRPKETYDGAVPSGNSAAFRALRRLYAETGGERWKEAYEKQRGFIASEASRYPAGFAFALTDED